MRKLTFEVYHGAGYEVICGFEAKGKRFLALRHTRGNLSETMLVELTNEAIRRRDPGEAEQAVLRARLKAMSDADLLYLCGLQEGQTHYVIANPGVMRVLGMKVTKLDSAEVARTIRGKVFALVK